MFKKWRQKRAEKRREEIEDIVSKFYAQFLILLRKEIPPKEFFELQGVILATRQDFMFHLFQRIVAVNDTIPSLNELYNGEKIQVKERLKKLWKDKTEQEINEIVNDFYGKDI